MYETIGTRKVNINERKNKKPWFAIEIKALAKGKKYGYIGYISITIIKNITNKRQ